ncbi:MAG: nitroreductase, partial [Nitrosopumilus sp.]|nr:nitroreductase [Nitrosopumilus sp.]
MSTFSKIEPSYFSKDGCRLVWTGLDEDDTDTVILNKDELLQLVEILKNNHVGNVELEDNVSEILINSDVVQFRLKDRDQLEASTDDFRDKVLEYAKVPHEPQSVQTSTKEFYATGWTKSESSVDSKTKSDKPKVTLLQAILSGNPKKLDQELSPSDLFRIFGTRRSTRKFAKTKVEDWKIEKILAAADTAPTAGNFQGLEVYYVKSKKAKEALVEAANRQPFVNAPLVLIFCMNPDRVKMNFSPDMLTKFSLQDATIAATYSQLAAHALGLSSIWIGMIDEKKVQKILGTE